MANSLITPTKIAKVGLAHLENNLVMGKKVYREYKKEFVKVGDTVNIRRPVRFTAQDGATAVMQDVTEGNFSITIDTRKHVAWEFSTQDLTLTIEEYSKRYIEPACITLANQVDYALTGLYNKVWNWVGTPGQTVNSLTDFLKAPERLDLGAAPKDSRQAVFSPADHYGVVGGAGSLYIPDVARDAYRRGTMGTLAGISTDMDQNIRTHTTGALAGGGLVNGASQNVTYAASKTTNTQSLITDDWTGSTTFKAGDVFTIADVYAVNPISKATLPHLQQFVIQSDVTADGSGNATLTIAPAIITSGAYQNVSAAPGDDAAITVVGSGSTNYPQNLVFHRNAFALVMCDLEMPDGASWKARENQNGFSIRVVKDYDFTNDKDMIRLDILFGVKAIYPDLATRLNGTA